MLLDGISVQQLHLMTSIIRLNVGGIMYTTTRIMFLKYFHSVLGAMFGNGMPMMLDDNGCYFIDCNG